MGQLGSGGCCRRCVLHSAGVFWGARGTAGGVQILARLLALGGGVLQPVGVGKGAAKPLGRGSVSQGTVALLSWVCAEQGHMPGCPPLALGGFRAGWGRCGTGVRSVAGTWGCWGPAQNHPGPSPCPADSRFITPVPAPVDARGLFSAFRVSAALPWLSKPISAPELL